jgi:hypothetical protein
LAGAGADGERRAVRAGAWIVLAAAALYTLVRAWRLEVDYYDSFIYLYHASRFLGEPIGPALDDSRPWLLAVVQAPVVALCRLGGPGNAWLLRGPHLLNAAMSLGAVAALFALLRRRFGATLALVGAALFVAGPAFVHYAANTLTDLAAVGLCALTVLLHQNAVGARRLGRFALAGVTFGLAVAMKFTSPMLVAAILATEVVALVDVWPAEGGVRLRLRLDPHRHVGLLVEGLVTAATFAAVELGALGRFYGRGAWTALRTSSGALAASYAAMREPWTDYFPLLLGTFSVPVVILGAVGVLAVVARPRRSDAPFVGWFAGVGAGLLFGVAHNESRYLFLLAPAVMFFAIRGIEAAFALGRRAGLHGARAAAVGVALLVAGTLAAGVAQARADDDPVETRDLQRWAARGLAARRPGSQAYTVGTWVTLAPASPGPMPEDEFWNTFNATPFVTSYLLGETTLPLPGAGPPEALRDVLHARLVDGGRALRYDGTYFETRGFPTRRPHQGFEVWSVRRHDLERVSAGELGLRVFEERRPTGLAPIELELSRADLEQGKARTSLTRLPPGGPWWIYTKTPKRTWAFATASDAASSAVDLPIADAADVDGIDLVRVDVERME